MPINKDEGLGDLQERLERRKQQRQQNNPRNRLNSILERIRAHRRGLAVLAIAILAIASINNLHQLSHSDMPAPASIATYEPYLTPTPQPTPEEDYKTAEELAPQIDYLRALSADEPEMEVTFNNPASDTDQSGTRRATYEIQATMDGQLIKIPVRKVTVLSKTGIKEKEQYMIPDVPGSAVEIDYADNGQPAGNFRLSYPPGPDIREKLGINFLPPPGAKVEFMPPDKEALLELPLIIPSQISTNRKAQAYWLVVSQPAEGMVAASVKPLKTFRDMQAEKEKGLEPKPEIRLVFPPADPTPPPPTVSGQ